MKIIKSIFWNNEFLISIVKDGKIKGFYLIIFLLLLFIWISINFLWPLRGEGGIGNYIYRNAWIVLYAGYSIRFFKRINRDFFFISVFAILLSFFRSFGFLALLNIVLFLIQAVFMKYSVATINEITAYDGIVQLMVVIYFYLLHLCFLFLHYRKAISIDMPTKV